MWRDSIRFLQRIKFILEKNTKLKTDILKLVQSPSDIDKSLEVKDTSRSEILYTKGLDITWHGFIVTLVRKGQNQCFKND